MATKLKYITFVFENLDTITIDGRYVGAFLVDDIHTKIQRIACNSIEKISTANTFVIEIHKDANVNRYRFNQVNLEDFKELTFDRFTVRDITSIEFELEKVNYESNEYPCVEYHSYYVYWDDNGEYCNMAQNNYLSQDKSIYIVIAKDKSLKDFFDLQTIDSCEKMELYWEMRDVFEEDM